MDRNEEQLMSLGFFATIKESLKIIFSWKKIFSQITISLILPLAIIFATQIQIYLYFYFKLYRDEHERDIDLKYPMAEHFEKITASDSVLWRNLTMVAFLILTIIFYLLSTAAVVYTIGSVYTSKPVTYKKIMAVVPRVWKRLTVTFLCGFLVALSFTIFGGSMFYAWGAHLGFYSPVGIIVFVVLLLFFLDGTIHISVVWHVASVVSVLEEEQRGNKAFKKANQLVKGKLGISLAVFAIIFGFYVGVWIVYQMFVFYNVCWFVESVACVIFLTLVILFELVVQTVIYLVCKSYHRESAINGPELADHLDAYAGSDHLKSEKGIQMDQLRV